MQRLVIHYLQNSLGEPVVGKAVVFELKKGGHKDNTFYPGSKVVAISDENGYVEAELWVNGESESEVCYTVTLPGCEKFDFVIPVGDTPITLGALKEAGLSWEDPKYLATINYLKKNSEDLGLEVTTEKSYEHTQDAISNEWVINHNLDKFPSVVVVDGDGVPIEGIPEYLDRNNLKISFQPAISGMAYLN